MSHTIDLTLDGLSCGTVSNALKKVWNSVLMSKALTSLSITPPSPAAPVRKR